MSENKETMKAQWSRVSGLAVVLLVVSLGFPSAFAGFVQRSGLDSPDGLSFALSHREKPDEGRLTNTDAAQQSAWNVELIGEMAIGVINAVAVQGSYAYIGLGPRLVVLDVSDPSTPTVAGQTTVLPDVVRDVYVAGDYAYLAAQNAGLRIVDISDPATSMEVGSVSGHAQNVYVADNYAYVTGGDLRVINVSNPEAPVEVGVVWGVDGRVYVAGNHAYVAAGPVGLRVIDVSNPATPVEVSVYDTPGYAADVHVAGNYAYVADGGALRVIDVSDPMAPKQVGFYKYDYAPAWCTGYVIASSVYVIGNYAHVARDRCADWFGGGVRPGLDVVDVSDPGAPVKVGGYDVGGDPVNIFVAGSYVYVVEHSLWWYNALAPCGLAPNGLRVIDISNLARPQQVGFYRPLAAATGLYVTDSYAYVADPINDSLGVIDVSDPTTLRTVPSPLPVRSLGSPYGMGHGVTDVFVAGNYVYVTIGPRPTGLQGMSVFPRFDTGEAARPLNGCSPPPPSQWFRRVYVLGDYAYVVDMNYWLRVLDVSKGFWPEVGAYDTLGNAQSVYVVGDYAYVADGEAGLRVIDVSDPAAPVEVGAYDTPGFAADVHVVGNYAYVADGDSLRVVDISDPVTLVEVGFVPVLANYVYVSGSYAYVTGGGLRVINVSDPSTPVVVGAYEELRSASRVHAVGSYVYVLATGGLFVFRFVPPVPVSVSIPPTGGSLTSPLDQTTYTFPAGAFTETVTVTHTLRHPGTVPSTVPLVGVGHFFEVKAVHSDTGQPAQPTRPYTVTVRYTDAEKGPVIEDTLALYWWDGAQWVKEPTSVVDPEANTVIATPDRFSLWAVLGETWRMFFPLILRKQ